MRIHNEYWFFASAHGIGIGLVSIIDPVELRRDVDVSKQWSLVAYLCVGYPVENTLTPELEKAKWVKRTALSANVLER